MKKITDLINEVRSRLNWKEYPPEKLAKPVKGVRLDRIAVTRRLFLRTLLAAGAGVAVSPLLPSPPNPLISTCYKKIRVTVTNLHWATGYVFTASRIETSSSSTYIAPVFSLNP